LDLFVLLNVSAMWAEWPIFQNKSTLSIIPFWLCIFSFLLSINFFSMVIFKIDCLFYTKTSKYPLTMQRFKITTLSLFTSWLIS
jgi:hypothetical protein